MKKAIPLLSLLFFLFVFTACEDDEDDELESTDIYFLPDVDPLIGDRFFDISADEATVAFQIYVDVDETGSYEVIAGENQLLTFIPSAEEMVEDNRIIGPTITDDEQITVTFDPIEVGSTTISLVFTDSRNNQSVAVIPVIFETE